LIWCLRHHALDLQKQEGYIRYMDGDDVIVKAIVLGLTVVIFAVGSFFGMELRENKDQEIVCSELYSTTRDYFACTKIQHSGKIFSQIRRIR